MEEKIIKRNYEKNFQKYLWNQYDNLHDRLTRKIGSLSKILSSINDIYHVKKEYYKSLKPLIKDEPQPLSEEENFRQTMVIIKNNNEKFIEFEDEMYSEIIDKIRSLIEKMKQEKFLYDDFINHCTICVQNRKQHRLERLTKDESIKIKDKLKDSLHATSK